MRRRSPCCSHFSGRHDQLSVICRTLATPTRSEFAWASAASQAEIECVCKGWSNLDEAARTKQRQQVLVDICPYATDVEIDLLAALLSLEPRKRPTAAAALMKHPYFAGLEDRPPLTPPADEQQVGTSLLRDLCPY
eukprot:scaffold284122_cov32-Tisochrysis_lutea.AAC.2